MTFPFLPILSALGSGLSAGAGSESTTDSNMESTTTGNSTINRSELDNRTIRALTQLLTPNKLAKNQQLTNTALRSQLNTVTQNAQNPFDIEAFVNGIVTQAKNTIGNATTEGINLMESDIGGTQGTNSMAALGANKMATDAAAQLSGMTQDATARGYEIAAGQQQSNTESILGLTGQMNKNFTDFLTLLRGAKTHQTQKTKEHTEGSSTSTTSSPFNIMEGLGGMLSSFKMPT